MFEVGKRYWARNGEYRVKVLCVKRTARSATFTVSEREAARYFGTKPKFTKRVSDVEVPDREGRPREVVYRLNDRFPGAAWCITDEEVRRR